MELSFSTANFDRRNDIYNTPIVLRGNGSGVKLKLPYGFHHAVLRF